MSTSVGREGGVPLTARPGARVHGGLPLTVRFTEADYVTLLRIAAARSTTAAHLIEELVHYALDHSAVPDAKEPLQKERAKRAGDLIADGETDDAISRVLGVTVTAVASYRANHPAAPAQPDA